MSQMLNFVIVILTRNGFSAVILSSLSGDTLKVMTSPPRHFDNGRHSPKNYSHHHKLRNKTAEKEIEEEHVADDDQYLYDDDFADVSSSPNKRLDDAFYI